MIGDVLWTPPPDTHRTTEIGRYMDWLGERRGLELPTYERLWRWSIDDLQGFWGSIWEFFGIRAQAPYERVLGDSSMPGAEWFTGAGLNYAEHLLGAEEDRDRTAVVACSQTRPTIELAFGDLREQVSRCRLGLRRLGVGRGDRVVAFLPNIPETLVAFAATASLGAIWAVCAPEWAARAVVGRFSALEPKVLLAVGGYGYRGGYVDRRTEVEAIRAQLRTLEHVVWVPYGDAPIPDAVIWPELLADSDRLEFEPVPFDHPLYVLFSSGTTGAPKAIVHGHGGQLLEHHKHQGLVRDLKPGERFQWFSSTSWVVWNTLISGLLLRASIVMIDGDPTWPDQLAQWRIAEQHRVTVLGVSPPYLMACRTAGVRPGRECALSSLRVLCTTGSALPAAGYRYVYEQFPNVLLINGAGGTDLATGIVSGSFAQPVYEGEISGPCLGVDARAYDAEGNEVVGEIGELVICKPMPSMPVALWNDPDGSLYRAEYFDRYPGVWRQHDLVRFTDRGSCVIVGRSDATLNRGGVRLGTGEFYAVVEDLPEIVDSLVINLEDAEGGPGELLLFVVPAEGVLVDRALRERITAALRTQLSPRHVPDRITPVSAVPRSPSGKKLEVAVKRILRGERPDEPGSGDSAADLSVFDAFVEPRRPS